MNLTEKIKKLCEESGVSIHKLEMDLKFSNGSLAKSKMLSFDRVVAIANYFRVPIDYFLSDDETELQKITHDSLEVAKAVDLYDRINKLTPANQIAILTLLDSLQKDV